MQQALEQQILFAKDKMYRFALRLLGDAEDARDAVQDALLRLWRQRERLAEIENLEAWSMQIIKNLCLDRLKAQKLRREASGELRREEEGRRPQTPYEAAVREDHRDRIAALVAELPEKFRMVLHLRDVEGLAYKEIAEVLAMSMDEVRVNLFRARQRLKEKLVKNKVYGV